MPIANLTAWAIRLFDSTKKVVITCVYWPLSVLTLKRHNQSNSLTATSPLTAGDLRLASDALLVFITELVGIAFLLSFSFSTTAYQQHTYIIFNYSAVNSWQRPALTQLSILFSANWYQLLPNQFTIIIIIEIPDTTYRKRPAVYQNKRNKNQTKLKIIMRNKGIMKPKTVHRMPTKAAWRLSAAGFEIWCSDDGRQMVQCTKSCWLNFSHTVLSWIQYFFLAASTLQSQLKKSGLSKFHIIRW